MKYEEEFINEKNYLLGVMNFVKSIYESTITMIMVKTFLFGEKNYPKRVSFFVKGCLIDDSVDIMVKSGVKKETNFV